MMTQDTKTDDRTIREVRIRAARFMKAARSGDEDAAAKLNGRLKHRHALDVAARDLTGLDYRPLLDHRRSGAGANPERFFDKGLCAHWNHWFASYAEASAHRTEQGGFLFPYRAHFVVLDADAMRTLRLEPDDPDWRAIGFDWVKPTDVAAYNRLSDGLCAAGYGSSAALSAAN